MMKLSTSATAARLLLASLAIGVTAHAGAADTTRVIVAFKPGKAALVKAAVSGAHGAVKHEIDGMNAMAIEVPTQALNGLLRNPNVEYIEEDVVRKAFALTSASTGTPYATGQLVPYGIKMVQADLLPDANTANRKVCIIDSGYDRAHEDLSANSVAGEYDAGTGN